MQRKVVSSRISALITAPFRRNASAALMLPGAAEKDRIETARLMARLTRLPFFAHHPACKYWGNHLVYILGQQPLCLGCACMYSGIVLGGVALTIWSINVEPWQRFAVGAVAYIPTPIQIYYQRYSFKILSRLSLGFAISFALSAVVLGYPWDGVLWTANLGFLATVLVVGMVTYRWRARHLDVPCERCLEGQFPFCSWKHRELQKVLTEYESRQASTSFVSFLSAVDFELQAMEVGRELGVVKFPEPEGS